MPDVTNERQSGPKAARRPANLIYGLNDPVPLPALLPLVAQQIIMLSVDLIFPVLLVAAMSGSVELTQTLVSLMMISMGFGTILQAWGKRSIGSGYFCAQETSSTYFPVSVMAVQAGGIPLLCGMTMFAGLMQALFSRIVKRLRVLFPVEITGLIVMFIAMSLISYALPNFIGLDGKGGSNLSVAILSLITLGVILVMYVWGTKRLREYSIIAGILFGYMGSYFLGLLPEDKLDKLAAAPWVAFPHLGHIGFAFDPALILPFLVASLCSSIKTIGNLTTCQKVNDDDWKRLDVKSVGGGLLAEGLGTMVSGFLGTVGQTTSSGSIGLSVATGATSRKIAYATGLCFMFFAFLPKISALFAIMPQPVIGVVLLVEIAFILPAAMQICSSRMLDARRLFVLGMSMAFGIGVEMVPAFGEAFPLWLQPLTKNSLAVGTVTAIFLHMLFRIGIAKHHVLEVEPGPAVNEQLFDFFRRCGGEWGARAEVVSRATSAVAQCLETLAEFEMAAGRIKIDASFEEFNLDVEIEYEGSLPELTRVRPTEEELLHDEHAFARLSGYLLTRYADKIATGTRNGKSFLRFNFEH